MRADMRGDRRVNRGFVGVPTFLRADYAPSIDGLDADYAVIGVPFDEGSPYMPGSRFGPRSIREHSMRIGPSGLGDVPSGRSYLRGVLADRRIVDLGDVDVMVSNPAATMQGLTDAVRAIRGQGVMPIVIGGDHTLSYPAVRGYDEPIHVIQLDAHLDYSEEREGMVYTNGQGFRLLHGLDHVESLTQIGIRSQRDRIETLQRARAEGSTVVDMPSWRAKGADGALAHIPEGAPCYVSIDVDVYDLPLVPGCVSGEPGGPGYDEVRETLRAIARRFRVVGFDFVEVNPLIDAGAGATSYLGALTIAGFLGFIADGA